MTAILQLNPPLHVVTPKGEGWARLVIDYGIDHNPVFVVDLFEGRSCLCVDSNDIYFGLNLMYGLTQPPVPEKSRA